MTAELADPVLDTVPELHPMASPLTALATHLVSPASAHLSGFALLASTRPDHLDLWLIPRADTDLLGPDGVTVEQPPNPVQWATAALADWADSFSVAVVTCRHDEGDQATAHVVSTVGGYDITVSVAIAGLAWRVGLTGQEDATIHDVPLPVSALRYYGLHGKLPTVGDSPEPSEVDG